MKRRRRFAAAALAVSGMIFIYLGLFFKEVPLTGHELKYQVYDDLAGYAPAADYSEETGIININSAGVDELMLLEGIGETKAKLSSSTEMPTAISGMSASCPTSMA